MGKRLKNYLKAMGRMLDELEQPETNASRTQMQKEKEKLLVQIGFFQHERLIHLIVTALFALLAMIVLVWVTMDFAPGQAMLFVLLFVLLVPYIRHYYILENGTQKLYQYYDRLEALSENAGEED